MATRRKRTLNAETYPAPDAAGEAADAEARGAGEETRRPRRARRRSDSPRARRERYDREPGDRQLRAGRDGDPLAGLKLEAQRAQDDFLRHLRTSRIASPGASQPDQGRQLNDLHRAYVQQMVIQCLEPLRGGLNAQSVLTTVGMGTAMWLLSPNFRTVMGQHAERMATAIDGQARREARITAQGEKARAKEARHFDRTGERREGMRGPSGWMHRRHVERLERLERGGRDPFTEHSAALAHVGIAQNAYDEMRRPGADRDLVRQNYQSTLGALYDCVDEDGLDREEVARDMRDIVGQLVERDPEQAAVFAELGHGRFVRSGPATTVAEDTNRAGKAREGDYVDARNGDVITGGTFSLREPMGTDEHRAEVARTMYAELTSTGSPAEFKAVMEQYVVGSTTLHHPEAVERTEDASARARLSRARTMFASMRGDGISEWDQKLVYVGGFVESLQAMEQTHPQKVAQWRQSLGLAWEQRMRDLISENSGFGEQADRARTDRGQRGPRGRGEPEQSPERGRDEEDIVDADTGPGSATQQWRGGDMRSPGPSGDRPSSSAVARRLGAFPEQRTSDTPSYVRPAMRITSARSDPEQDKGSELGG
ncbi:hypothetical protein [Nocardiopsis sp. NRRL B-16309]|uniref:hypothetical protein n=1 Tax=Nocardiopsis sp. NRRL B-16309 TaxID=1519494 RepID=UPI0006AEC5BA|nr:hypothetical protein [Nocardiopsis sp. NRRL B-16309]KOX14022.1 hypothetical protein ADL05_17430 [Nocardiopsis sp. NRRL B-16309]